MYVKSIVILANGVTKWAPPVSGKYNIRQIGSWNSGTNTITESNGGFSVVAGKSANDKTAVDLERGVELSLTMSGAAGATAVAVTFGLLERYNDRARNQEDRAG